MEMDSFLVDFCRVTAHLCDAKAVAIHLLDSDHLRCAAKTDGSKGTMLLDQALAGRVLDSKIVPHQEEIHSQYYFGVPLFKDELPKGVLLVCKTDCISDETKQMLILHARYLMENNTIRFPHYYEDSIDETELSGNVVEGVFQTTPDGRYLAANTMLARIYGYETQEELMEELRDISGQLYAEPNRRNEFVRMMKENDVITNFVSRIRRRDDEIIWISENVHAVRDADSNLLYYEGTVTDVTEKRIIEDALRESEILYHSLVENIPQNILRKDMDGKFTFANKNFCRLIGHPLNDVIGKEDNDFFPDDLAEKYRRDDLKVIETGKTYDSVEEHETADGGKLHVHVVKTPLYDMDGSPTGIQCMFWDVTERQQVEEQLAFERDLLRALLENVPDRIYFKDTESRFVRCSRALADRLGLNMPEETFGKTDYDFHPDKDAREYHEDEQRVILTDEAVINKVELQTGKDGHPTWASVTKVPFRNRAGITTGIIGISRDITALKQAEEEMQHARDLAEESALLKAQFLATMSHEIRTPMNAIIGMIDLLLSTNLDDEQREYAGHIRTSSDALLEILNDILDLSKVEAGQLKLEKEGFNLRELVEDAIELHALRAQEKNVELACYVPTECAGIHYGDSGRLRQVLLNLVSNAVKFTENGTVRITVSAENSDRLRFEVRDTGIGIASELQPKIFEAFRQADGSTTRKYGGTGLGLAISRELVELMDGELGVESEPESGSVFWFTVQLDKEEGKPEKPFLELDGKNLLLGIPDGFVRRSLEESATEWGMRTDCVSDGLAARHYLESADVPEMVLLDLDLPGCDVLDLVQFAHDRSPNAHVLILTTRTTKFDPAIIRAMGVASALTKPVKCRRLGEILAEVLRGESTPNPRPTVSRRRFSLRVLVVEDNQINQRVAQLQLEKLGCHVTLLDCGEAAIVEDLSKYDLIFMDCQMPGMDGLETTQEIRKLQEHQPLEEKSYIIAMTANALEEDRRACIDAGMDGFISKPVQTDELQNVIRQALGGIDFEDSNLTTPSLPQEALQEILPMYLSQARKQVATIEKSVKSNDTEAILRVAHQLKGSSSNLGASALAELCSQIENTAANGTDGIDSMVADLRPQMDIAETQLRRLLAESSFFDI